MESPKKQFSGNLHRFASQSPDGYTYMIHSDGGKEHWQLPTANLTPTDLRKLADELERVRSKIAMEQYCKQLHK